VETKRGASRARGGLFFQQARISRMRQLKKLEENVGTGGGKVVWGSRICKPLYTWSPASIIALQPAVRAFPK